MASLSSIANGLFNYGSQTIKGFSTAYGVSLINDYVEALQRGASPNTILVRAGQIQASALTGTQIALFLEAIKWTRLSWLITPFMFFLPLFINGWPRANAQNLYFNRLRLFLREKGELLSTRPAWYFHYLLAPFLLGMAMVLDNLPQIENRFVIKILNFLDKHLLSLSLMFSIIAYAGLFLVGYNVLAIAAACTLLLGVLDRYNLLPMFVRNTIKKYGINITILSGLFFGSYYEMLFSLLIVPFWFGHLIGVKKLFSYLAEKFEYTQPFGQRLEEQNKVVNNLDFRCHTSQFLDSIQAMTQRQCAIVKSHVLDNTALLPPLVPHDNLNALLALFDNIAWDGATQNVVNNNRQYDWRLARDEDTQAIDYDHLRTLEIHRQFVAAHQNLPPAYLNDVLYLRNNLTTFIHRIRTNDLHSVRVGAEDLAQRYAKAITEQLTVFQRNIQDQNVTVERRQQLKTTTTDLLIRLSFESGDYCGIALLRTLQGNYRSLHGDRAELTLKECVRTVHQIEREQFFQDIYLYARLNMADSALDTHAYSRAIATYAPRLGLAADFAHYDEMLDFPPMVKDLLSAVSPVEMAFWDFYTPQDLKTQLRNAFNTPLMPVRVVDKWYRDFVYAHTFGTDEQKEALLETLPYDIEMHGVVPHYRLKEEVLHLMVLDFGVLALRETPQFAENTYRPPIVMADLNPPVIEQAHRPNYFVSLTRRLGTYVPFLNNNNAPMQPPMRAGI